MTSPEPAPAQPEGWSPNDYGVLEVQASGRRNAPPLVETAEDGTIWLTAGAQRVHLTREGYEHWRGLAERVQAALAKAHQRESGRIARGRQVEALLARRAQAAAAPKNRAQRRQGRFRHERFASPRRGR